MKADIIVAENFYADPDAVVDYALSLEYVYPYNRGSKPRDRVMWRASKYLPARECPFKSSTGLIRKLESLTGERIDRTSWRRDYPLSPDGYPLNERSIPPANKRSAWWNCCFHVKHHAHEVGTGVHSHTDRDAWNAVGLDGWAGIVYLNKTTDYRSGMMTWKNTNPKRQFDYMTKAGDWKALDYLANPYNRLILVRGSLPHSGIQGWGTTLQNGRLFQTFFFRVQKAKRLKPISKSDLGI